MDVNEALAYIKSAEIALQTARGLLEQEPTPMPPDAPPEPRAEPNRYTLELINDDNRQPRPAACMDRLKYGHHDKLILGLVGAFHGIKPPPHLLYQVDAGNAHKPEPFAQIVGPHGPYEIIANVVCKGNQIHVVPESNSQGCKHHVLIIDEHSRIIDRKQYGYEWSHADHDRIDFGAAAKCPRTERLILGYGNTTALTESYNVGSTPFARPQEIGKPLKGLLMEVGGPVFGGRTDSYTNQLPGYPRSWVVLDNGDVLVGAIRHGGNTTSLIRVESRDIAPENHPGPGGRRAPRKQGAWVDTGRGIPGWGLLFDPYTDGGEFNNIVLYFSSRWSSPRWAYRGDPTNLHSCIMRHAGGVVIPGAPGTSWGYAIHPTTKRPIVVNGPAVQVFYEAFWQDGQVNLQEVANLKRPGEWNLTCAPYRDAVYTTTGRGPGPGDSGILMRLVAV